MKSKFRAFVAIELPEKIKRDIRKLQHAFASHGLDIRWVKPANMHLTVKFLGDVDPSDIESVGRVLSDTAANHPMFDLTPRGVGVFPNIRRPSIVWTGIAGQTDVLGSIHRSVNSGLSDIGFESDKRPYRGHLTLGRIKTHRNQNRLVTALRVNQEFVSEAFSVERLVMFKSELQPAGPVYTRLCEGLLGN
jgi:RNA 2',3'-cyclic 3'-phosphodiesterase